MIKSIGRYLIEGSIYRITLTTTWRWIRNRSNCARAGATSTWGIDQSIYNEIGFQGFRFFRIVQVGKNSSGSDNLILTGLEGSLEKLHMLPLGNFDELRNSPSVEMTNF